MPRLLPKSLVLLRQGEYTRAAVARDAVAGLTVAIIALPLAMALGIASIPPDVVEDLRRAYPGVALSPPAMGLYTAVIAGFLISALGGSRVQIGGPTAAFIPIVFGIASTHGYEGLATATVMAGVIVALMGLFRFGAMIKFIPYPVTTGFTSGIAVTILASQVQNFLGLRVYDADGRAITVPADFIPRLRLLAEHAGTISWQATAVGLGSLGVLIALRRFVPRVPGAIVVVALSAAAVRLLGWDTAQAVVNDHVSRPLVETIGSRYAAGIPRTLPPPHLPAFSLGLARELIFPATTIAILCAIESLLSAVVADGMTGRRHKADCELVGQGVANVASAFFFGVPATGAIARTVANIKSGGSTPLAGMFHAAFILLFMVALAPLAASVPLPALAAILVLVAWNIAEVDHFRNLLRAPRPDVLVLLTTFGLTVFTDLTIAVGVGMVLASLLFMKRMAETSNITAVAREFASNGDELDALQADLKDPNAVARRHIPPGVEVYEIDGPFFFGVADRLKDTLNQFERPPRVFILRMRKVPHIDATGLHALEEFHLKCRRQGTLLLLGGVHAQPLFEFVRTGFDRAVGLDHIFENLDDALDYARRSLGLAPEPAPAHEPEVAREELTRGPRPPVI
jgi:SulP family sulfate permease